VSEDLLVIYATVSEYGKGAVRKCVVGAGVWAGVVGSDCVTYFIGRAIGRTATGIGENGGLEVGKEGIEEGKGEKSISRRRLPKFLTELPPLPGPLRKLLDSPFVGFYIRFMFGFRGPMMLWAGFMRVGFTRFVIGSGAGAVGSLGIQAAMGWYVLQKLN